MPRVLLISPHFPPSAAIGAKRSLNLARHLRKNGWDPVVLAAPPERGRVDDGLAALVPPSIAVFRTYRRRRREAEPAASVGRTARPATNALRVRLQFLTPLDRYLWAAPTAVTEALKLIREYEPAVIAVNADPWSGLLVGHLLHRLTGLPWVADLRDPWSLHAGKMSLRPGISRAAVRSMEARFFDSAARIVLNCESAYRAYLEAYAGRIPASRFTFIRNAFDDGIYEPGSEPSRPGTVFTYFGTFKLFVGSEQLLAGFSRYVAEHGASPADVRLRVIGGPVLPEELARHRLDAYVDLEPPRPLRSGLRALRSATALPLVVEPKTPLVPGKLYDYLAARRPILAISDNPEVDAIIRRTGAGLAIRSSDTAGIAAAFAKLAEGSFRYAPDETLLQEYSAEVQAERFAAVLDACAHGA